MPTVTHIIDQNLPVYATGNQTISGVKAFVSRPTVNNTGVLLSGEVAEADLSSTVRTTGNQTISGVKAFVSRPTVNNTGVLLSGEVAEADLSSTVRTTGNQTISGIKTFATEIVAPNLVYNTGDQIISGTKIFGSSNTISSDATNSTILGGSNNRITGNVINIFIANGSFNVIGDSGRSRPFSSYIGHGFRNVISGAGNYNALLHGSRNITSNSDYILIGNGLENIITGGSSNYSVLMNGANNSFTDTNYVFLGNGTANCIGLDRTGDLDNSSKATHSSIINGSNNRIIGNFNIIGGGSFNQITGSPILDCSCQVPSRSNVIVGGANNLISESSCSAILGGRYNEVIHNGATLIGDGSLNIKTSKGACTLLLSFSNGIYLESPLIEFNSRPTVSGNTVFINGDGFPNSTLPIDSVRYTRMPFGIKANLAPQVFDMVTGKASIVPFYIGKEVSNYKAISQRLGASANGPWTIRVALYDINSGVSSPKFIESSNIQFNTETVSQQKIANFTGDGSSLIPGWYAHVSWVVSGNGTLKNTNSCTWSNRPFLGITGYGSEIPAGPFGETFVVINDLTGPFYATGSPTGIGTIMTTSPLGTDIPWFFPYY